MAWSAELIRCMKLPANQLLVSENAVVIKDKYPKARYHYLVLPWKDIDSVYQLAPDDSELLSEMRQLGERAATLSGHPVDWFQFGYHMKPSMERLHLHVISRDYDALTLKNRYHWNAFHTDFFMLHDKIVHELQTTGNIQRPSEDYVYSLLATPLRCNQCVFQPRNIPELKRHLKEHVEARERQS